MCDVHVYMYVMLVWGETCRDVHVLVDGDVHPPGW